MANRRDGFFSIRKVAREMCRLIFVFTPIIKARYPEAPLLHAALETANVACSALVEQIDAEATPGV